jgi:hypothetical protein
MWKFQFLAAASCACLALTSLGRCQRDDDAAIDRDAPPTLEATARDATARASARTMTIDATAVHNLRDDDDDVGVASAISDRPSSRATDDVDDDRPFFVVHIGPHKTGTTFLQGTLCAKSADAILDADHMYYLGTSMRRFRRRDKLPFDMRSIFNDNPLRDPEDLEPGLNDDFATLLTKMKDEEKSGILIHEALHKIKSAYVEALARELNEHWRVVVVMGYRPLNEWLLSRFNQFIRDEYSSSLWPDGTGRDDDDDDDEEGFPPELKFGLVTDTHYDSFTMPYLTRNTSVFEESLIVWNEYFDDVRLVDIPNLPIRSDGKDPLLMHFMCEIMPSSTELCRRASDLADESGVDHSSSEYGVAYHILTTWSWQMHLIDRRLDRKFVRDHIGGYHRTKLNGTALSVVCPPSSDVDVLRSWTLRTDENLFRNTHYRDDESSEIRSRQVATTFEKWIRRNKFCTVDVTILLRDDWKPLFAFLADAAREMFDGPINVEEEQTQ